MSELMKNFSQMMNNQQMPENIKNILGSMSMNNNGNGNLNNTSNKNSTNNKNSNNNNLGNSSDKNISDNCDSFKQNNANNNNFNNNSTNNIFEDIDFNTILKFQKVMNSINNDKQNDSRANLLMSLKPYLKESRKSKVDQYIQLMKMGKVFEIINPLGGDKNNV